MWVQQLNEKVLVKWGTFHDYNWQMYWMLNQPTNFLQRRRHLAKGTDDSLESHLCQFCLVTYDTRHIIDML